MKYQFSEILDIPLLTRICEGFTNYSGIVTALLDIEGNVHIGTGWQDICTKFHRQHPEAASRCRKSDTALASQLKEGNKFNVYHCENGLVDVAFPIILENDHIGNFFTGQFFLEKPDTNFFRNQARKFGFDEQTYMDAVARVPVLREEQVKKTVSFLAELTQLIGKTGVERLRILKAEKRAKEKLEKIVKQRTHELNMANSALEDANKELFKLARIDGLTNIFNRRAFEELMIVEWKRMVRSGDPLSLFMIDIDQFKLFNDRYGHQRGDECIATIAESVKKCLRRPSDFLARYGGEEFICLLPETHFDAALLLAESIQQNIKELALPHEASSVASWVTLSIGAATCRPKDGKGPEDLISAADHCLYQAKNNGRNCIRSQQI